MLGLLAHKFTWRARRKEAGLPTDKPNVVFGAETHVVWDKFARYFDVEMRKIPMRPDHFVMHPDDVEAQVDENTIAVGAVVGTTFIGENDPIVELNDMLVRIKNEKGWNIPLHVDGASGGFIAPFAHPDEVWDFRLEQVASINASGHKYGMVYPGVGWLVFRDRDYLPEDLVFNVNYLGGAQPTFTFNFSRASAMIQAQYYLFVRLGHSGYKAIVGNMMANAKYLNEQLEATGRFEIMNPRLAEPVVDLPPEGGCSVRRVPPRRPPPDERVDRAGLHPAAQRRARHRAARRGAQRLQPGQGRHAHDEHGRGVRVPRQGRSAARRRRRPRATASSGSAASRRSPSPTHRPTRGAHGARSPARRAPRRSLLRRAWDVVRLPPPHVGPILSGRIDGAAYLMAWLVTFVHLGLAACVFLLGLARPWPVVSALVSGTGTLILLTLVIVIHRRLGHRDTLSKASCGSGGSVRGIRSADWSGCPSAWARPWTTLVAVGRHCDPGGGAR